jgi:hypothetical protein
MLRTSAQTSGIRRVAAVLAAMSIVLLLALGAHAHDEVTTDAPDCAICSCVHHSDVPIPSQITTVATLLPQAPVAEPPALVPVTEHQGALPSPRAPPSRTPNT